VRAAGTDGALSHLTGCSAPAGGRKDGLAGQKRKETADKKQNRRGTNFRKGEQKKGDDLTTGLPKPANLKRDPNKQEEAQTARKPRQQEARREKK
jgi:hypothetical protein